MASLKQIRTTCCKMPCEGSEAFLNTKDAGHKAYECREMQDKLVGKQALIAERVDEITKIMDEAGCTAHLTASLRAGL